MWQISLTIYGKARRRRTSRMLTSPRPKAPITPLLLYLLYHIFTRLSRNRKLFLFERKSYKKKQKSLQDLSALSAPIKTEITRLSLHVIFARASQKFGGTERRGNDSQIFYGLRTRYRREQLCLWVRTILQRVENLHIVKICFPKPTPSRRFATSGGRLKLFY